ncbi:hypothetical protein R1sor_018376 [Riccia sorocarpa]|uniref:Fatty acid hydroxylase domain-containing protein n=1 Tax=Riccia sorocarpa TaxID=122646 RepID=A0ABD3IFR4_9MARC
MIEYGSVAQAEAALGRALSRWELKWFEWTADVSDFNLYMMNFVFLLIIYTIAPLPSYILDVYKVSSFEKYRLQPGVHNTKASAIQCYLDTMKLFIFLVFPLNIVSWPTFKMIGVSAGIPLPSVRIVVLQLFTYFIIEDYLNYWLHRWLHSEWGYNKIHYMHHEFTAPQSYAAAYSHFAEMLILGIPTFMGPALVPGHMITFWLWIALRQLEAIDTHSGYDFPFSLTKLIPLYGGPEYHDYHHFIGGKSQSNFASVFTYCDWLYGTDKGFRYHKDLLRKTRKTKTTWRDGSSEEGSASYENSKTTNGKDL